MSERAWVEFDDREFRIVLKAAMERMGKMTKADLLRLGYKVANKAKTLCPVDTGRLRSSISVEDGEDGRGYFVKVGTNVEYAPYVEFGTYQMPAQPYLRPALLLVVDKT